MQGLGAWGNLGRVSLRDHSLSPGSAAAYPVVCADSPGTCCLAAAPVPAWWHPQDPRGTSVEAGAQAPRAGFLGTPRLLSSPLAGADGSSQNPTLEGLRALGPVAGFESSSCSRVNAEVLFIFREAGLGDIVTLQVLPIRVLQKAREEAHLPHGRNVRAQLRVALILLHLVFEQSVLFGFCSFQIT